MPALEVKVFPGPLCAVTAFYHEVLVYGELGLKNRWYFSGDGFSGSVTWSQGTVLVGVGQHSLQWPPILELVILGFHFLPGIQQDGARGG